MRVLSLFDGMACGLLALKRAGIPVTEYHAFEIDKHAIQVAKANHPEIIHHGEITFMTDFTQFKGFDLLIGGSPCQGFSFAGKQLNFSDPRSQLFFEFVRAKREAKPKYFMLENVKMKKEFLAVIDQHLGVESVVINSALVSAQNRVRHYWCNWKVEQPADRGIYLRDIIEDGEVGTDCTPLDTPKRLFNVNPSGNGMNGWVYSTDAKAPTITTNKGEGNKIGKRAIAGVSLTESGLRPYRDDPRKSGISEIGTIGLPDTKSAAVTSAHAPKFTGCQIAGHTGEGYDMNGRVYSPEGKSPTLITNPAGGNRPPLVGQDSITYRKLTPIECERLQTVPDNYTAAVSNTQRYRMLGNGWTVEVIAHIFSQSPFAKTS